MKHNKYKNIGVIYEALCASILREVGDNNNAKAKAYMKVLKKYFMSEGEIRKAFSIYQQLLYNETVNYFYADKFMNYLLSEYNNVNNKILNEEIGKLFENISEFSNKKDLMKIKTPNYKLFASFNILSENVFNQSIDRIRCEKIIAEHLVDNKEASKLRSDQKVYTLVEGDGVDQQTRKLADILAIKSFEEKYKYVLNEDQKDLLIKYITSNNFSSFNRWVNRKIKNVLNEIENFEHYSLDTEIREKLYLVNEKLKNLTGKKNIEEGDLQTVLLCFKIKDSLKLFE